MLMLSQIDCSISGAVGEEIFMLFKCLTVTMRTHLCTAVLYIVYITVVLYSSPR